MKHVRLLITVSVLIGMLTPLYGGWWIFGKSKGEVRLVYLHLNGVDVDEMEGSVAFTPDLLADGLLLLRGKAKAGRDQIGAVEVSIDGQESWQSAKLAQDGTFEFSWRPEADTTYELFVKVLTTTGKSNEVEETRLDVRLLEQNLTGLVRDTLRRLVEAYQTENPRDFMANVSENFAGDPIILDRAIRDDFSLFDDIRITFTINNLAIGRKGRIVVGVTYQRSLTAVRGGDLLRDWGTTEFTFVQADGRAKIWAMKVPLIFGVSAASEVATGSVGQPVNQGVIVVGESGTAKVIPFHEAERQADDDDSEVITGDFQLQNEEGWNFADDDYAPELEFEQMDVGLHAWGTADAFLVFNHAHGARHLGAGMINDVNEVPADGYTVHEAMLPGAVGHLYAVRTTAGHYAIIEVVSFAASRVRIRYKYQPNGTRLF